MYSCANCSGELTTASDMVTVNVEGRARAAHRTCPKGATVSPTSDATTVVHDDGLKCP